MKIPSLSFCEALHLIWTLSPSLSTLSITTLGQPWWSLGVCLSDHLINFLCDKTRDRFFPFPFHDHHEARNWSRNDFTFKVSSYLSVYPSIDAVIIEKVNINSPCASSAIVCRRSREIMIIQCSFPLPDACDLIRLLLSIFSLVYPYLSRSNRWWSLKCIPFSIALDSMPSLLLQGISFKIFYYFGFNIALNFKL